MLTNYTHPHPPDGRERESSSMVKGILLLVFFQIVMPLLNHLIIFSPLMISEIQALGFKLYTSQPILRFPQFAKQQIIASLYRTHSGLCTLNLATSLSLMFQRLQTGDAIDTCFSSTEGRKAGPGKIKLCTLWEATYVTLVTSFWKLVNFLFSSLCPIHRAIWICWSLFGETYVHTHTLKYTEGLSIVSKIVNRVHKIEVSTVNLLSMNY